MGLSMYVWFTSLGFPHNTLKFPYVRQSPLTKKNKEYKNLEEVESEIMDLVESFKKNKFTLGRNLYFHIPLFANPEWFIKEEYSEIIKEYNYTKNYGLPIANNLEEADSYKLDCFDIIHSEINAMREYLGEKNG